MSYDLCVYSKKAAPKTKSDFHQWYEKILEWDNDGCSYDDIAVCSIEMQQWYKYMLTHFPAMNGRDSESSIEEFSKANGIEYDEAFEMTADYSISPDLIYVAFGFSQAEEAYSVVLAKAKELGLGFYDPQNDALDVEVKEEMSCQKRKPQSFKRESEKAIKELLSQLGFAYKAKEYTYFRNMNEDIIYNVNCSMTSCFRNHYYEVKINPSVASRSLNYILHEVTDGRVDFRDTFAGPIWRYWDNISKSQIFVEFIGDRPMEENVKDFKEAIEKNALPLYALYSTQKSIYTFASDLDNYDNKTYYRDDYVPLAYFFKGEFDKAFTYIDEFIKKQQELAKVAEMPPTRPGLHLNPEAYYKDIETFQTYKKNLQKWIEEKRQFKVDDEYLPIYKCGKGDMISRLLKRIRKTNKSKMEGK